MLVTLGFLGRVMTESDDATTAVNAVPPIEATDGTPATISEADFLLLDEILRVLESDFVDQDLVDAEYLHSAAIAGIFEALGDPHSTYIDPETYALSRDDFTGAFQGIGATVEKPAESDFIVIVRPLPETPAEAAGVISGDQILEVDGEDAFGWTVDEGVIRIRGPQGTPVDLLIRHPDGTEELITIIRDEIQVSSVTTRTINDSAGDEATDIGYVYINAVHSTQPRRTHPD